MNDAHESAPAHDVQPEPGSSPQEPAAQAHISPADSKPGPTRRLIEVGAMLGTCIAFLIALSGAQRLDRALTVAVMAFAAAIPFLLMDYLVVSHRIKAGVAEFTVNLLRFRTFTMYELLGAIGVGVGIIAVLAHLAGAAVIAFIAASIFLFVLAPALTVIAIVVWLLVLMLRKAQSEGRSLRAVSQSDADIRQIVRNSRFLSLFRPSWANPREQRQQHTAASGEDLRE
jgi:hypothetical protein